MKEYCLKLRRSIGILNASKVLLTIAVLLAMAFSDGVAVSAEEEYIYIENINWTNGHVMSVPVGETVSMGLEIDPAEFTEPLSITSSKPDVLAVDSNGNMTGVSAGTATVTVSYGFTSGEMYVAVLTGDQKQVLFCEANNVIRETTYPYKLEAVTFPEGETIVWTSMDPDIATVTEDGTVTGLKAGTATIKAAVADAGDNSADYLSITFTEAADPFDPDRIDLIQVLLDGDAITVEPGNTVTPEWKFLPDNHTQTIYYVSDNPEIASVDENGNVTGHTIGGTVIHVGTQEDMSGGSWQFNVYVTDGQTRVFVRFPYRVVYVDVRNADHLDADIIPLNEEYHVIWESSDDSIGSIDENGDIVYHKRGLVKFFAKIEQSPEISDYVVKLVGTGLNDEIVAAGSADGEIVNDVVDLLRNETIDDLKSAIEWDEDAQGSLKQLEETYTQKNGIEVSTNSEVPEIPEERIGIVGAGLNAKGDETILNLAITETDDDTAVTGYEYSDFHVFDMSLNNEAQEKIDMSIPVVVTLPIPDDVDINTMNVIHAGDDGTIEVINPVLTEDQSSVILTLSHFSTFAFAWNETAETISRNVTFKVKNGKWDDGTTADKTVELNGEVGDKLCLSEDQIPAVGSKPADGYKAGNWDTMPKAESPVTEDMTFTYTYVQKASASVTKAPTSRTLTCSGFAQALINSGSAEGGTLYYAIGRDTDTAPTAGWSTAVPTGIEAGTYHVWYKAIGDADHNDSKPAVITVTINEKKSEPVPKPTTDSIDMHRMYNPNSGEHFYTGNIAERDHLISLGWNYEGVGFKAPKKSNTPMYRLYNPNAGDHHYTYNVAEKNYLVSVGWNYEGIGWYADDNKEVAQYRLYNPNATGAGSHHYTDKIGERDYLISIGWKYEGIGFYTCK